MKRTTITCDGPDCARSATGNGYSTLWARLKAKGWRDGKKRGEHYCPVCAEIGFKEDRRSQ